MSRQWWDDLWLNEGFATYMMYLGTEALFPDMQIWTSFVTDVSLAVSSLTGCNWEMEWTSVHTLLR